MRYFFEGLFGGLIAAACLSALALGIISICAFAPWLFIIPVIIGVYYTVTNKDN